MLSCEDSKFLLTDLTILDVAPLVFDLKPLKYLYVHCGCNIIITKGEFWWIKYIAIWKYG